MNNNLKEVFYLYTTKKKIIKNCTRTKHIPENQYYSTNEYLIHFAKLWSESTKLQDLDFLQVQEYTVGLFRL